VKGGADIGIGIDHPEYRYQVEKLPQPVRDALATDLA